MLGGGLSNRFGQSTTSSSGVTTYNIHNETNIGNIAKEVDETEVQQKLETAMSEYGYMSG